MDVCETTIYLVGADPELSSSMRVLLETNRFAVIVVNRIEPFMRQTHFRESDVILLELDRKNPAVFKAFNQLANKRGGPKMIVTADQAFNFRPCDILTDNDYEVLVHPIAPKTLMTAIKHAENSLVSQ